MKTLTSCSALALIALWSPSTFAGPTTFRFEAEISEVYNWQSLDFGVKIAEGQRIVGQFTFQPVAGEPKSASNFFSTITYEQPYTAFLEIDGVRLSTSESLPGVSLTSHSDNLYICDCVSTVGFNTGPFDELHVSSSLAPNEVVTSIDPERSYWKLELKSGPKLIYNPDGSVAYRPNYFPPGELPTNVETWNALNSGPFSNSARRMIVGLADANGNSILFYANVGPLEAIAISEPTAITLLSSCLGLCILAMRPQNRSK